MALDATVASAAANSYLTIAEADALAHADPVSGPRWLETTLVEDKERALIAATSDVDLYRKHVGERYASTQALLFPRVTDVAGDPAVAFLPLDVKRATYEQAVYLVENAHLIRAAGSQRASGHISRSDATGGWQAATNPTFGLFAPKMVEYLDRLGAAPRAGGRYLVSVPIASGL